MVSGQRSKQKEGPSILIMQGLELMLGVIQNDLLKDLIMVLTLVIKCHLNNQWIQVCLVVLHSMRRTLLRQAIRCKEAFHSQVLQMNKWRFEGLADCKNNTKAQKIDCFHLRRKETEDLTAFMFQAERAILTREKDHS